MPRYSHSDLLDLAVRALPPGVAIPTHAPLLPEARGRLQLRRALGMGPRQVRQFAELLEEEAGVVLPARALDALLHPAAMLGTAAHMVREALEWQDRHRAADRPQRIEIVEVTVTRTVIHA